MNIINKKIFLIIFLIGFPMVLLSGELFKPFGFDIQRDLRFNIDYARKKGLKPAAMSPNIAVFSGEYWENPNNEFKIVIVHENRQPYYFNIEILSDKIEIIEKLYSGIKKQLDKHFKFLYSHEDVNDDKIPGGSRFQSDGYDLLLCKFENNQNKFYIELRFSEIQLSKKNALRDFYQVLKLTSEGYSILPERKSDKEKGLPKFIQGEKVYIPELDKRIKDVEVVERDIPKYPGYDGYVRVLGIVDKKGSVCMLSVSKSTSHILSNYVETIVKAWRFKPATLGGKPVYAQFGVSFNFTDPERNE